MACLMYVADVRFLDEPYQFHFDVNHTCKINHNIYTIMLIVLYTVILLLVIIMALSYMLITGMLDINKVNPDTIVKIIAGLSVITAILVTGSSIASIIIARKNNKKKQQMQSNVSKELILV